MRIDVDLYFLHECRELLDASLNVFVQFFSLSPLLNTSLFIRAHTHTRTLQPLKHIRFMREERLREGLERSRRQRLDLEAALLDRDSRALENR